MLGGRDGRPWADSLAACQGTKAGRISPSPLLHSTPMDASRRPSRALLVLLVLDLLLQAWGLARGWDANPNLRAPLGDARTYWDWSEDIAGGDLVADTPFLSAPLYPYFLGLVRVLGGGMLTVYVLQLLLRTATAWLLARSAGRLFGGAWHGFATAALFLLLSEPAFYASRLLNVSLQLFTVAAVLDVCVGLRRGVIGAPGAEEMRPLGGLIACGLWLGIAVLSNPALLIVLPVFAWWLGLRPPRLREATIVAGLAFLCVLPATLHNRLATANATAGPEWILLSAQAGVTFSHGNAAGANGTYHPLAGISANRDRQNEDAYAYVKEQSGEEGWAHTSEWFLGRGLDWMMANPGDALALELAKLRWFLVGRNYGDLYNITLENADPAWPRPVPLPGGILQLGWLLPMAFVGMVTLWRRDRREALPVVVMLLAVLFVVLVFWYSPRYRLPVAPPAALLAPFGVVVTARWLGRRFGRAAGGAPAPLLLAAAALVPPVALESWTVLSGFDGTAELQGRYENHAGHNALEVGQPEEALRRFRAALEAGHEDAALHISMAKALVELGSAFDRGGQAAEAAPRYDEAIAEYRLAVELNPARLDARFSLASVLDYVDRREEARTVQREGLAEAERQADAAMVARFRQLGERLR
jgi:tetratricopeptide (TPR) repeat protein